MVNENTEIPSYSCDNYVSCYYPNAHKTLDSLTREEIQNGKLSVVNQKENCIHTIGAIVKEDLSVRPITDCKRPLQTSVSWHTSHVFNL